MNSAGKLVVKMGLPSLLSVMPLAAQIDNGVDFTSSFPFYAGDTKLPAGQYKSGPTRCECRSITGREYQRRALGVRRLRTYVVCTTHQSDVTFQKYRDTDHLNRAWIEGHQNHEGGPS